MVLSKGIRGLALAVLLSTLQASCRESSPPFHHSEEVLAGVLADMHLAKAAVQQAPIGQRDSLYDQLFLQICERHHVDKKALEGDVDLLLRDPARAERIYDAVLEVLDSGNEGDLQQF